MAWSKIKTKFRKPIGWWWHKVMCELAYAIDNNAKGYYYHLNKMLDKYKINLYGERSRWYDESCGGAECAERKDFRDKYLAITPSKEYIDKQERALDAALAYERNCIAKYDYPDWMGKPSRPPKKGERMGDYAGRFGTTIQEMKDQWRQVERAFPERRSE